LESSIHLFLWKWILWIIQSDLMNICIVQTKSAYANVTQNIQSHLEAINKIKEYNVQLIVFPELSITGYEPKLAHELAVEANSPILDPFQRIADSEEIIIGIGVPLIGENGITISMVLFQAEKERLVYSKSILHKDEFPYFVSGTHQPTLNIDGVKISFGICYETSQREHFMKAARNHSDLLIASVAKSEKSLQQAKIHFPKMAKEFGIPVLMSNTFGYNDNFMSAGKSSIWDKQGKLLAQLDGERLGYIIYDIKNGTTETVQNH